MGYPGHNYEQTGNQLQSVYVARTVKAPQPKFERFLQTVARRLGRRAVVNAVDEAHLTFLESHGVKARLQSLSYTPDDMVEFKSELQDRLRVRQSAYAKVRVRPEMPLKWMTRYKLAVMIEPSDILADERGDIEDFLIDRFGELPYMRDFDPHITIAEANKPITGELYRNPRSLLPPGLAIPTTVTLNGLWVYMDRIHQAPALALAA